MEEFGSYQSWGDVVAVANEFSQLFAAMDTDAPEGGVNDTVNGNGIVEEDEEEEEQTPPIQLPPQLVPPTDIHARQTNDGEVERKGSGVEGGEDGEEQRRVEMPEVVVSNIVCKTNIGCKVDLLHCNRHIRNSEKKTTFPALFIALKRPNVTLLLYSTGSLIATGCAIYEQNVRAFRKLIKMLVKLGKGALLVPSVLLAPPLTPCRI